MSTSGDSSLPAALERELASLEHLQTLLDKEQQALLASDEVTITTLASAKANTLQELAGLVDKRMGLLASVGVPGADPAALARHVQESNSPEQIACRPLWKRLASGWRKATATNAMNAQIVQMHLARAARALNVLSQAAWAIEGYGADGRTRGTYFTA